MTPVTVDDTLLGSNSTLVPSTFSDHFSNFFTGSFSWSAPLHVHVTLGSIFGPWLFSLNNHS